MIVLGMSMAVMILSLSNGKKDGTAPGLGHRYGGMHQYLLGTAAATICPLDRRWLCSVGVAISGAMAMAMAMIAAVVLMVMIVVVLGVG